MVNTKELKPGDPIAYNTSHSYANYHYDNVAKVTPSGMVTLANGRRFTSNGKEVSGGNYGARLVSYESAKAHDARNQKRHETNAKVEKLNDALRGVRTGGGDYHIPADSKAMKLIEELTAELTRESDL